MSHEIWCSHCGEDQRMHGRFCCDAYKKEESIDFIKRNGYFGYIFGDEVKITDVADWLKAKGMK